MSDSDSGDTKRDTKRGGKGAGQGNGRLTVAERTIRDLEALELKKRGVPYWKIAQELGFADQGGAQKAVKRVLEARVADGVDEYREIEGEAIDDMIGKLLPYMDPDLDAEEPKVINARMSKQLEASAEIRKWRESKRKLYGVDAPAKQEVSGPDGAAPFSVHLAWPMPSPDTEVIDEEDLGK